MPANSRNTSIPNGYFIQIYKDKHKRRYKIKKERRKKGKECIPYLKPYPEKKKSAITIFNGYKTALIFLPSILNA